MKKFKFKKDLGQVFLQDKNYIRRVINSLEIEGKDVLEIGSARGEMTRYLLDKAKNIFCVEYDNRLAGVLQERFSSYDNVEVINNSILEIDMNVFNRKLVVFGNVPYYISNHLIRYLIKQKDLIYTAFLTFQKEFAHKLCAQAGSKLYGYLSCYLQYFSKVEVLFDIPRTAFYPIPRVDSSMVRIDFYKEAPYEVKNEKIFFQIIKTAFSGRRKKLSNSLSSLYDKQRLKVQAQKAGIDLDRRADALALEDYCKLANCLD